MGAAVWMAFAIAVMIGIFVACVLAVAAGIRVLEDMRDKRSRKVDA